MDFIAFFKIVFVILQIFIVKYGVIYDFGRFHTQVCVFITGVYIIISTFMKYKLALNILINRHSLRYIKFVLIMFEGEICGGEMGI